MKFSKRGQEGSVWAIIVWLVIILAVGFVIVSYAAGAGLDVTFLDDLPDAVGATYDTVVQIVGPLVSGIYLVVAPADQPENVQMIAFAIFLLLTLVGTKSLKPFLKGPFLALLVSAIIGIIAARSLTATILEDTALGASPIAAVSLLLGFIPIFALTRNIDAWGLSQWSKMFVFTTSAAVYFVIFWFAFDALTLGAIYGAGILLLGAGQLILPYWKKTQQERTSMSLGRYMAGVEKTVETVEGMKKGSE